MSRQVSYCSQNKIFASAQELSKLTRKLLEAVYILKYDFSMILPELTFV